MEVTFNNSNKGAEQDLPKSGKLMPFAVPESYFLSLEDKIREKTAGHRPDGAHGGLYRRSLRAYAAMAAAFLFVVGLGYGALKLTSGITGNNRYMAGNTQTATDTETILDSLENLYYAGTSLTYDESTLVAEMERFENAGDEVTKEEIEEYITLAPSPYTSLLADEISNIH